MPLDVLSNIAALAKALDISVMELLPSDIADVDQSTRGQSVPGLRDLVLSYRFVNPRFSATTAVPVDLATVKAAVADVWTAYQASRFSYVVAQLQRILPVAFVSANEAAPEQRQEFQAQLAYLYQVAASVLTKLGELDLAMLCADRGESAIQGVDALAPKMSLQRSIAHALLSNAQFDDALAVIEHSAGQAGRTSTRRSCRRSEPCTWSAPWPAHAEGIAPRPSAISPMPTGQPTRWAKTQTICGPRSDPRTWRSTRSRSRQSSATSSWRPTRGRLLT